MRNIAGDLKHAVRLLVQSPAFTIAAILTLALGIGANTAMFTLADATLLRPLQIREPDRLAVWNWSSAYPDFQEYQKHTDVFEGVAAVSGGGRLSFIGDGVSDLVPAVFVSGQRVRPLRGQSCRGAGIAARR